MKAKDNPFRVEQVHKLHYIPAGATIEDILTKLRGMDYRGALVGPHGSGKTTLIEELIPHLEKDGFRVKQLFLNTENPSFERGFLKSFAAELQKNDIVVLDGAEQLSKLAWHRFRKASSKAAGLIITTHAEGRLPTLYICKPSAERQKELIIELAGKDTAEIRERSDRLFEKHGGNIRESIREMYDIWPI